MNGTQLTRAVSTCGRVVVGVDDSPGAREALRHAAEIARWRHFTLHIVHAWQISYPVTAYSLDVSELEGALQDSGTQLVADLEKEVLGDETGLDVRRSVVEGPPARVLVHASDGADLLVVGNRGRGGLSSLALGSVGQSCVHHARCPVLIVRPSRCSEAA